MEKIEESLQDSKMRLQQLEAPEELEARLRTALDSGRAAEKPAKRIRLRVAAVLIAILLLGCWQLDTLAYYGKRLIGYDRLMNSTLQELNKDGNGQDIGKSYTYKNGTVLRLDGIMLDENQLLVFFTIKNPNGDLEKDYPPQLLAVKGFWRQYNMRSATAEISDDKTEATCMAEFSPPLFIERTLDFQVLFNNSKVSETSKINFVLDRSKAMGHVLKKTINRTVAADSRKIHFDSVLASPTRTVIKGSLESIGQLAWDQLSGQRMRPNGLSIRLLADGKELAPQSSGMSTDMKGITFHFDFDALPGALKQLQLQLISLDADFDVGQQFELQKGSSNKPVKILGKEISIGNVYESDNDTYVTITSRDDIVLTRVHLIADGNSIKLKNTISDKYDKTSDGTILHTRTLHFPGTGKQLKLDVQRMSYEKEYNELIDIPVN